MVDLEDGEWSCAAVCAVRYALGRMTYVVGEVCQMVAAHAADLSRGDLLVLVRDITEAERRGGLGMDMDASAWVSLREKLFDELQRSGMSREKASECIKTM